MIGILFDLDGTLVDSSRGILDSLHCMLDAMQVPSPDDQVLRRWIGPPLQVCAEQLAGCATAAEVDRAVQVYRNRYREVGVFQTELFPGIRELLEGLAARGDVLLGVATSKPTDFAAQILEQHNLHNLLPVLCGADWAGKLSKADLIAQAISQLRATPDQSVMIGDRHYDISGGQQHELATIGVTYGFGARDELEEAGADIVCDSVEQLGTALSNFLGD